VTAALIALIAWIVAHLTPAPAAMTPAVPPPVVVEQLEEPPAVDQTPAAVDPEGPATDSPLCTDGLTDCWLPLEDQNPVG
jgi:hypothetical protein